MMMNECTDIRWWRLTEGLFWWASGSFKPPTVTEVFCRRRDSVVVACYLGPEVRLWIVRRWKEEMWRIEIRRLLEGRGTAADNVDAGRQYLRIVLDCRVLARKNMLIIYRLLLGFCASLSSLTIVR